MEKKYDLVLWGATGFTGRLVAEYLTKQVGVDGSRLRWAIAGRNQQKLTALRQELAGIDAAASQLPILIGDSHDAAAMAAIVGQTRVVCATVGPFALHGTSLVAACAAQGVDYCDITGEVQWIGDNIRDFHAAAAKSGARIVHCCGYDSIPSDLGAFMLQEHAIKEFGQPCSEIKFFLVRSKGGFSGGTVASLFNIVEQVRDDRQLRRKLADPFALVPGGSPHGERATDQKQARWDEDLQRWTAPFLMAAINTRIVRRSNYLLDYRYGRRFDYQESTQFPAGFASGRLAASGFSLGLGLFQGLAAFAPMRKMLTATVLPKPGDGPDRETREGGSFLIKLLGKLPATGNDPATHIWAEVSGEGDPGYNATARMLGESALCLAQDDDRLSTKGGILTPAAAMGQPLLHRLRRARMTFTIRKTEEVVV